MKQMNKLYLAIEWIEKKRMNPESKYFKKLMNEFED